jgi:hypothetical protein
MNLVPSLLSNELHQVWACVNSRVEAPRNRHDACARRKGKAPIMDIGSIVSVAGALLSVVSLALAAVQTVRIRELRRRANADVWLAIGVTKWILRTLESTDATDRDPAVREGWGKAAELFRHLVKLAALDEREFSEETIMRWRKASKLDSDWQVDQARLFLAAKDIR